MRREYEFDVVWKGFDDQECFKTFSVSSSLFHRHIENMESEEISNPDIQIRFLPSDPRKAVIAGTEFNWGWFLYGGIACFLFGLSGFTVFLYYDIRF
jgi:hypothetical protein